MADYLAAYCREIENASIVQTLLWVVRSVSPKGQKAWTKWTTTALFLICVIALSSNW